MMQALISQTIRKNPTQVLEKETTKKNVIHTASAFMADLRLDAISSA